MTHSNAISDHGSRKHYAMVVSTVVVSAVLMLVLAANPLLAKSEPDHAAANLKAIDVNDGFAELVKAVKPAVVNISVTGTRGLPGQGQNPQFHGSPELEEFFRKFFGDVPGLERDKNQPDPRYQRKTTAVGSGFIIDPDGLVVTNNHVVEGADEIEVVFDDGTRVPASLRGTDQKTDLALLEVETDIPLPYVIFGDSDKTEVGDWVVAIGNPFGLGGSTTSGIVSARGRNIQFGPLDDFIQIDAPINRGNSGGPLFNTKGEVIGVNSAIYTPNGGSVGIGFAIPASMAGNVISQLAESGTVERGFLGVHIQSLNEEIAQSLGLDAPRGALITEVMEDSPAADAGLESGDVILEFNGKPVDEMRDLPKLVAVTPKGEEVEVEIWRNDERENVDVVIGTNQDPQYAAGSVRDRTSGKLGLGLAELNSDAAQKYGIDQDTVGVVIVDVAPESVAAQRGLQEGDIIKRVGNKQVDEPADVFEAIEDNREQEKESVLLLVERNKQSRFIALPMNV